MTQNSPDSRPESQSQPAIVGDIVFGGAESPVAVCTLGSRSMLPALAGRPEIAVAGRVFTENVGVERMVQNLAAFETVRFLIVCGRETRHRVGETIVALHRNGLDRDRRVVGSGAPEPIVPNLTDGPLRAFQERITVVDMIGVVDAEAIVERAAELVKLPVGSPLSRDAAPPSGSCAVEIVAATRDPASAWDYDPAGYFLVFVDRARGLLLVEQHDKNHRLVRVFEGRRADALCHTILRSGSVTLLAHAAYLGRELALAETALTLGLEYDQDRPLSAPARAADRQRDSLEETGGEDPGNRRAP